MSPVTGSDLLRALGSGVRPAGVESSGSGSGVDFAALLKSARAGEARSGLPVSVDASIGVELDAAGHERLSAAVDRLEAAGAERGVVLMDGQALLVDVSDRSVSGLVDGAASAVRVDAIVRADADEDASDRPGSPGDPLWELSNEGLGRLLAG